MENTYSFIFTKGLEEVERKEMTFNEARPYCLRLAKEHNAPIRMSAFSPKRYKTEYLGTYHPNGAIIDLYGDECRLVELPCGGNGLMSLAELNKGKYTYKIL